jgi:hypothetical protein
MRDLRNNVDHEIGCDAGVITAGVGQLANAWIVRAPPAVPDRRVEPRNGVKLPPAADPPSRSNRFGRSLS